MRWIVYLDLDAFYLSCELTRHPEARGKPAIVAHDPKEGMGRGVVLSASYEARAMGFRSAMSVKQAWQRRELVSWFPPDFEFYEAMSLKVFELLRERSPLVRSFSIDEAAYPFPDVAPEEVAAEGRSLQDLLREGLSLPSSIGIAKNLSLSKIASDRAKPGGVVVVPAEETSGFLAPLPIRALPGIGPVTARGLEALGVKVVRDLVAVPPRALRQVLGSFTEPTLALVRGDLREEPWPEETPPRSIGSMITFDEDLSDEAQIAVHLDDLAAGLGRTVLSRGQVYRTVVVRVRWGAFEGLQRSRTLPQPTDSGQTLRSAARGLLHQLMVSDGRRKRGVRTLGLTVQELSAVDPLQRRLDG